MPLPNELTEDEQAMFGQHGVTFDEPAANAGEEGGDQDQAGEAAAGQTADDKTAGKGGQAVPAPKTGAAADAAGQQGQQDQGQAQGDGTDDQGQPKMVPHAALHQERTRAAQAIQQRNLAMARMNAILQQRARETEVTPQMPDMNTQPEAYLEALHARLAAFEERQQEETLNRQTDSALESDELMFQASTPDYSQASSYYVQSRAQELLHFYEPAEAQRILEQEARQIAVQSWQRGSSAAQTIYQLAQARGYRPGMFDQQQGQGQGGQQGQAQQNGQGQQQNGQGQQRQGGAAGTVAAIQRGQQQSRSLSGGTGGNAGNAGTLNAEALLAMSDEEFEAHLKLGEKGADSRFAQIAGR